MNKTALMLFLLVACDSNQTPVPGHEQYVAPGTDVATGYAADLAGDPYQPPDPAVLECMPNLDGKISADELQAAFGVPISYLVNPANTERTVDLVGVAGEGDTLVWDWSVDRADDQVATFVATKVEGKWYADSFPTGEFVTSLDAGGTVDNVLRLDSEALWLLGVASSEQSPAAGQTLLVYDNPIPLFRFPIEPGSKWAASSNIKGGKLYGLPYAGKDTYEFSVDGIGELALRDLTFTQALRVRTKTTVSPAVGKAVSKRQVSFMFECFGEVARATSRNDETAEDFTKAVEVRRLGL